MKPGDSVLLDGSASYDPDNSASFLAYEWKTNTAISLGSLYDDTLEFVAPDYGQVSTLSFSLTAFGIKKRSVEDHVNVSIVDNYPPNALAGNDTVVIVVLLIMKMTTVRRSCCGARQGQQEERVR